jgi:hypothetical protein
MWIQDLRESCESNFDQRERGQLEVEVIRDKWRTAHSEGEVDESLLEGLERRSKLLIGAQDHEWSELLDDEDFWKAGWGSRVEE